MYLIGIDFETTGTDPGVDEVIEAAYAVYDTEVKSIVEYKSQVFHSDKSAALGGEWGKTKWSYGKPEYKRNPVRDFLDIPISSESKSMSGRCYVAHNIDFEKSFLKKYNVILGENATGTNNFWIDTMIDVPYPEHLTQRSLAYLAYNHGLYNPDPHRALGDVRVMLQMLAMYDIDEIVKAINTPMLTVVAQVSIQDKNKAKDKGFSWNPEKRVWYKQVRKYHYDSFIKTVDFKCVVSV